EVAQAANKANRLLKNWRSVRSRYAADQPVQADVDAAALAHDAIRDLDFKMKIEWRPTRHHALQVPAKDVFDSYLQRQPTFDKPDSKEFPDAFVVAALDNWCQKNGEKMYVITKDKAMLRAVAKTATLIPLPTLEDYLALLVDDPKVVQSVERVLSSSAWDAV